MNLEQLEVSMAEKWGVLLESPLARQIQDILTSGDRQLYAIWLIQVAHLTQHTSAHQAMVGTRFREISHAYMKFCYEHALEEVGHEMMAIHDLRKIGATANSIADLPLPLESTERLTAYLYYVSQYSHPMTRLGFSYWAEKCYPFIQSLSGKAQKSLGLSDHQMSFFVSHSRIDEKHAADVENIIVKVCKDALDWSAVSKGMTTTLDLAVDIFEEIHKVSTHLNTRPDYQKFLEFLNARSHN